ncbi:hypothetical protein [Paenibacillus sp. FSL K6-2393]|uniref:hypothetical protein n=1 Tax=Paenibacillus sp. FSL K6-2393 TaxID=2921475 RepID=UPI0030FAABD5
MNWSAVSSKVTLRARRSGGGGNAQKKRSALAMLQNFNTAIQHEWSAVFQQSDSACTT